MASSASVLVNPVCAFFSNVVMRPVYQEEKSAVFKVPSYRPITVEDVSGLLKIDKVDFVHVEPGVGCLRVRCYASPATPDPARDKEKAIRAAQQLFVAPEHADPILKEIMVEMWRKLPVDVMDIRPVKQEVSRKRKRDAAGSDETKHYEVTATIREGARVAATEIVAIAASLDTKDVVVYSRGDGMEVTVVRKIMPTTE